MSFNGCEAKDCNKSFIRMRSSAVNFKFKISFFFF